MKKKMLLLLGVLVTTQMMGAKIEVAGEDAGTLTIHTKAITVLSDKHNGFAPTNGSGYLVGLKYEATDILKEGFGIGVGVYVNGDAGLTVWDENNAADGYNKGAYGIVVTPNDGSSVGLMGELYLAYENKYLATKLGRQTIDSPLTKIQVSMMQNFYEAYMLHTKPINDLSFTVGQITKMSLGSRAVADSGIIGENTSTAGAVAGLVGPVPSAIHQAEFYNMGVVAGLDEKTNGRTVAGATYTGIENLKADFWLYHCDEVTNDFYASLAYTMLATEEIKVDFSGQYLLQKDTGETLAGERNFNMLGAKIAIGSKKWGAFVAMNQSGDNDNAIKGQYFNVWGADPAYTSSLFSRNAYRTDVTAYKAGAEYTIMKGLKLMVDYANYGQSKSTMGGHTKPTKETSLTDAYETDIVLAYKPSKEWMFRVFNAYRISEFDGRVTPGLTSERQMNHFRPIASYTF
jgi:hypothetical protein